MKILNFHQHFSTPRGSTGTRSYEMARSLVVGGHQVTIACGSYGGGENGLSSAFVGGRRTGHVDDIVANRSNSVLDAAAELKRLGRNDIKLVLIKQGKLKPELQDHEEHKGLDSVVFHPPVSRAKLAGLMAGTDVGMQILANAPVFYYRTSPNRFFDHVACGLSVYWS